MSTGHRQLPFRCATRALVVPTMAACLLLAGCSADDSAAPTATRPAPATSPSASIRGERYCEVLLVQPAAGTVRAEVHNSFPLNDCPESAWSQLDAQQLAAEAGVPVAVLNGPRFWLMDRIEKSGDAAALPKKDFGGIEMYRQASVEMGSLADSMVPYRPRPADRRTVFVFDAGQTVYELRSSDGATYVMQTWSQQKDPTLTQGNLAGLGPRLQLPAGWTYGARQLDAPLRVDTTAAPAQVLQDDLGNSYSKVTPS
ncbi:MAG: hypothetical protein ACKO04_01785 [Actinomycetes bacterium]